MTLQPREKRLLVVWVIAMTLGGTYWFATRESTPALSKATGSASSGAPVESVDRARMRLAYLRTAEATLAGKQTILKQVTAELNDREKNLLPGDSASQAQAQLPQILQRVAAAQTPPLQIRQIELGQPRTFGESYGLVTVSVTIEARIDEILNFLAGLNTQPEEIATEEIRFGTAHPKQKTMPVRITVSGVVPRRLMPKVRPGASS